MGVEARVMTPQQMRNFAEPYVKDDAVRHLEKGRVVVLGGGTGAPYFSTDTGAVLRGSELEVDALLFGKNVDGIYTADPKKDPTAVKLDHITYERILREQLKAIDMTAAAMGMDSGRTILVFGLNEPSDIVKIAAGGKPGTVIDNQCE